MKDVIGIVLSLIGIAGVMFLAYYSTKWLAKTQRFNVQSKYMSMIDKMPLGQNQSLLIVEIRNRFYLVSSTEKDIQILQELEGFIAEESPVETVNFKDILSKVDIRSLKFGKEEKIEKTK